MAPRERREKKRIEKEARGEAWAADEGDEVGGGMGAGAAGVSAASRCSLLSPLSRSRRVRTEQRGWTQRDAPRRNYRMEAARENQINANFASSPFQFLPFSAHLKKWQHHHQWKDMPIRYFSDAPNLISVSDKHMATESNKSFNIRTCKTTGASYINQKYYRYPF
jgi:hypothetical protein